MKTQQIPFSSISPFIRYAEDVYIPERKEYICVNSYDHRLFYVVSGYADVEINGTVYEVEPGSILYWMSGTAYLIRPVRETTLHLISINFDFTQDHTSVSHSLHMVPAQMYDPEKRMENIRFVDAAPLNQPIILGNIPAILPYLHAMLRETSTPDSCSGFQLSSLMCIVLTQLYRETVQQRSARRSANASRSILDYLNRYYAEDLDNKKLAAIFGYHPNYISQLIAEQTGIPLHRYLLKIRIRHALYLLQTTEMSICEIAHEVGFKSTSYFSQYFKQCTGFSPGKIRIG